MNRVTVSLTCDASDCFEEFDDGSSSLPQTRKAAREAGWACVGVGSRKGPRRQLDFCPRHRERDPS